MRPVLIVIDDVFRGPVHGPSELNKAAVMERIRSYLATRDDVKVVISQADAGIDIDRLGGFSVDSMGGIMPVYKRPPPEDPFITRMRALRGNLRYDAGSVREAILWALGKQGVADLFTIAVHAPRGPGRECLVTLHRKRVRGKKPPYVDTRAIERVVRPMMLKQLGSDARLLRVVVG